MRRGLTVVLTVTITVAIAACLLVVPASAKYAMPVESYAPCQPQKTCARKDKPGTVALGQWLVARGGVYGGTLRSCSSGGSSEHKDGRAFDWMLDAKDADDRAVADAFLIEAFADDELGDTDAWRAGWASCTSSGTTASTPPGTASSRGGTSAPAAAPGAPARSPCATATTCTSR